MIVSQWLSGCKKHPSLSFILHVAFVCLFVGFQGLFRLLIETEIAGGGLWMPEATALAAIRNNIDERPQDIKSVLTNGQVQKEFFAGTAGNETKTVKAFVSGSADNALKTKPKVGITFFFFACHVSLLEPQRESKSERARKRMCLFVYGW